MANKKSTRKPGMRKNHNKAASPDYYEKTVPIKGMHCASCEFLIGDELESLRGVTSATASLKSKSVKIVSTRPLQESEIAKAIESAGYEVGSEDELKPLISKNPRIWRDFLIGVLVVAVIYVLFRFLKLDAALESSIYGSGGGNGAVALIVGLTAGFSTCMALIGGLVLGVASKYAESHPGETALQRFRPHLFFNLGRIASFIVLGSIVGVIGSAFALKGTTLGLLTLGVGLVMIVLGLQLTELFPRITKGFTLPAGIAKRLGVVSRKEREYSHRNAFVMGAATFFLPCGFTQAMQLLAVSTGSPLDAAIIMGAFAIGTTPGLLSLGGITSVVRGGFAKRFFRVVGVVVIFMAAVNFYNGFNLTGLNRLIESGVSKLSERTEPEVEPSASYGSVLKTTYTLKKDIVPSTFTAKVGEKTTLLVDVKDNGVGCMSTIMIIGLDDMPQYLKRGRLLELTFTATKPGTYTIACAMGVPRGSITVTE